MPKFPQSFIDEVRAVADIVAVIQDYVSLKKAGASYKGLCPFHGEKSPSFTVNRDKGFFHCFGCGVGGDVFKFVELQEKLGFQDTVKLVAGKFGVPDPADGGERWPARERGRARGAAQDARGGGGLLRRAARLARRHALPRVPANATGDSPRRRWPRSSSAGRRIRATACTSGSQAQGFAPGLIRQSGLVSVRDDGSVDRSLSWPVDGANQPRHRVDRGLRRPRPRTRPGAQVPELARDADLHEEPHALRAEPHSKGDLRKSGFAIVVEGYFDFAQLFQAGGLPVVATCGTALTTQQAQMLRRFTPKVIINFDPDNAGQNAAERSCELLVGEGFNVNVARLPGGEDPDTFMQQHGREAYVAELQRSQPYLEFLLERGAAAHNLTRDDSRREFLTQMLAVAARIPDPATRDQFADRLAHKARVTEEVVRAEIRKAAAAKKTSLPVRLTPAATHVTDTERGPAVGHPAHAQRPRPRP